MKKLSVIFLGLMLFVTTHCNAEESRYEEFFQSLDMDMYLDQFRPLDYEGHVDREQIEYFFDLVQGNSNIKLVAEIGFNAGHSSEAFLQMREDILVVAFDLGQYPVLKLAKEHLDNKYPGRHVLILGDSAKTVPNFCKEYADIKFDLIFIDGGHSYQAAMKDIENMKHLSHKDTIVVMDDLLPVCEPILAWNKAKKQKLIYEDVFVDAKTSHKMWGQGRYIE